MGAIVPTSVDHGQSGMTVSEVEMMYSAMPNFTLIGILCRVKKLKLDKFVIECVQCFDIVGLVTGKLSPERFCSRIGAIRQLWQTRFTSKYMYSL